MSPSRVLLCVLDGWGQAEAAPGNAISSAHTARFGALMARWPHTQLVASGLDVGLPDGQQGNSEVGHLTIGAGRVVLQDLTRIDAAITDGSFYSNPVLLAAVELARQRNSRLHLVGLVSPGGVHSHQRHLMALCELARRQGLERVLVHAFTDGRDTPPTAGAGYLTWLGEQLQELGVGTLASLGGRYFGMDRDRRWERTQQAFQAIQGRAQIRVEDPVAYLEQCYGRGVTDEFVPPASVLREGQPSEPIAAQDVVVHFNFRPDRGRQLCHALVDPDFPEFDRAGGVAPMRMVTFANFDETLRAEVAFPRSGVSNTLAEVVAKAGRSQFHVAETEKYAHVTYFFSGGREQPFAGEERLLVPSPKVATYDLEPEMSAAGITEAVLEQLGRGEADLILVNYANADMVGHTGDLAATMAAVGFVDHCLGRVAEAAERAGYVLVLTADHGNAERMTEGPGGAIVTSHTTSPVPLLVTQPLAGLRSGGLRDVAPTVLAVMGLAAPPEMTGSDLREER